MRDSKSRKVVPDERSNGNTVGKQGMSLPAVPVFAQEQGGLPESSVDQPGASGAPVQRVKFGKEKRGGGTFTTRTGLMGTILTGNANAGHVPAAAPAAVPHPVAIAPVGGGGAGVPVAAGPAPVVADDDEEYEDDFEPEDDAPAVAIHVAPDGSGGAAVAAASQPVVVAGSGGAGVVPTAAPAVGSGGAVPVGAVAEDRSIGAQLTNFRRVSYERHEYGSNMYWSLVKVWLNERNDPPINADRTEANGRAVMNWIINGPSNAIAFYRLINVSSMIGYSDENNSCHDYSGFNKSRAETKAAREGGSRWVAVYNERGELAHSGKIAGGNIDHTASEIPFVMLTPIADFIREYEADAGWSVRYF